MMRVSNERLSVLAGIYQYGIRCGVDVRKDEKACLALDLFDARALLAKLNGVQFATTEERLAVVAEVSAYLAGGDRG
jgi:hypothetical protein